MPQRRRSTDFSDFKLETLKAGVDSGKSGFSILWKLLLLFCAILLSASIVSGVATYLITGRALKEEINFSGTQVVKSLAGSISTVISKEGAQAELQIALNKILQEDKEGRIRQAFILDKALNVVAAKEKSRIGNAYQLPLAGNGHEDDTLIGPGPHNTTVIAAPVQWGKKKRRILGYVAFEFSRQAIEAATQSVVQTLLIIFLVALVGAVLLSNWLVRKLLAPLFRLRSVATEIRRGNYEVPFPAIAANDEIGQFQREFERMVDYARISFRYNNPTFIRMVLDGKLNPDDANLSRLTISLCDGTGFSTASADLSADHIKDLVNTYFNIIARFITHYGGSIDKYMGDAVLAYYGVGEADRNQTALQAVTSKLCIQLTISLINSFRAQQGQPLLQFRYAIVSGNTLLCSVGSDVGKWEFTIMGSIVNLAARVEKMSQPGGLTIDRFTFLNAGGSDVLRVTGERLERAKGFPEPVKVFDVVGFADAERQRHLKEVVLDFLSLREMRATLTALPKSQKYDHQLLATRQQDYDHFITQAEHYLAQHDIDLPTPKLITLPKTDSQS